MAHSFHVERQVTSGEWVDYWSKDTKRTLAFRAACSCGWLGDTIDGDHLAGVEDEASREEAYERWDRLHVPDYRRRHGLPD